MALNKSRNLSDISYTVYTCDDSAMDDSFDIEQSSEPLLHYNKALIEGLEFFSQKDIPELIETYSVAQAANSNKSHIESKNRNFSDINVEMDLVLKSNLAIAYFLNSEVDMARDIILDCISHIEKNKSATMHLQNDNIKSLYIKLLVNLIVVYIVKNDQSDCDQASQKLFNFLIEIPVNKRSLFVQECIYILFRHQSQINIDEDYINAIKMDFQDTQLGCFNMVIGLTKELKNDLEGALDHFIDAFEIFKSSNDELFILLVTTHILRIYELKDQEENAEEICEEALHFQKVYENILMSPTFHNVQIEILFQNFDQRIDIAKKITLTLCDLEKQIQLDKRKLKNTKISEVENYEQENKKIWKQAVKMNLNNAIKNSRKLQESSESGLNNQNRIQLSQGIEQITLVSNMLEIESNGIILDKLFGDNYAAESINMLKTNVNLIVNKLERFGKRTGFEWLKERYWFRYQDKKKISEFSGSQLPKSIQDITPNSFIDLAIQKLAQGETLTKLNYTSSGSKNQFFVVRRKNTQSWASKSSQILNDKAAHSYGFDSIRGVVYGHVTKTFQKSSNAKKFEPWLCFSIIMKNRPFDVYAPKDKITKWFCGLSALNKIHNPNAYCISVGTYLWRRLKMVLVYRIINSVSSDNKKKILRKGELTFTKAILMYKHLINLKMLKVPTN